MLAVVTVCTGDLCRSPLTAQVLSARLGPGHGVVFTSVGTRAGDGDPMHPSAAGWSHYLGGDPAPHRSRGLTRTAVQDADLVLGLAREHRRAVVAEVPPLTRSTFTLRELARLVAPFSDAALRAAATPLASDTARLRRLLDVLAATRGQAPPSGDPDVDDVVDPAGRGPKVHELAARQVEDACAQVVRVLRAAVVPRPDRHGSVT